MQYEIGTIRVETQNDSKYSEYWTNKQRQESISIPLNIAPLAVPEVYISSPSEDATDIVEMMINGFSENRDEKDEGNEVEEEVRNSVESLLSPLLTYMRLLGLINTTNNETIVALNCHTVCKVLLLSYDGFTIRFAFTTAKALILARIDFEN
uniref:Late endosomal/lysosomal adaptor and MAPK and MTOR activator 5 n=1 Tax=Elaeophora elaphi TaxID=1147741 RepID=A0A0R3RSY9_9BILA